MGCGASVPAGVSAVEVVEHSRPSEGQRGGRKSTERKSTEPPATEAEGGQDELNVAQRGGSMGDSVFFVPPIHLKELWILDDSHRYDVREFYNFGKILGKGQFGTVRQVSHKDTGEVFACKSISKRKLTCQADIDDVKREVQIMHHLKGHPNIAELEEVYEDKMYVHLIMEALHGGQLIDSILAAGHYSEAHAARLFRTMVRVVAHCHGMGVMHRDLKPENFMLVDDSANSEIKAIDFGMSVFFKEGQELSEMVGTAFYVAPEVLRRRYGKEADIWSLGVLLYILLSGVPPFYGETEPQIFNEILTAKLDFRSSPWPDVSQGAKDCVRLMLNRDPYKRATADALLEQPWVREHASSAPEGAVRPEVLTRLQNFAAMNRLKQEALKVIATHLPDIEIHGLRKLFEGMDADRNGTISADELKEALKAKGSQIPEADLGRLMAEADINGNGTIDYEEFLAATMNLAMLEAEEHIYTAFVHFDTDGSGTITKDELAAALRQTSAAGEGGSGGRGGLDIDRLLAEVDKNGDGVIDYEEFCDMMRSGNGALVTAAKKVRRGMMQAKSTKRFENFKANMSVFSTRANTPADGTRFSRGTTPRAPPGGVDGADADEAAERMQREAAVAGSRMWRRYGEDDDEDTEDEEEGGGPADAGGSSVNAGGAKAGTPSMTAAASTSGKERSASADDRTAGQQDQQQRAPPPPAAGAPPRASKDGAGAAAAARASATSSVGAAVGASAVNFALDPTVLG